MGQSQSTTYHLWLKNQTFVTAAQTGHDHPPICENTIHAFALCVLWKRNIDLCRKFIAKPTFDNQIPLATRYPKQFWSGLGLAVNTLDVNINNDIVKDGLLLPTRDSRPRMLVRFQLMHSILEILFEHGTNPDFGFEKKKFDPDTKKALNDSIHTHGITVEILKNIYPIWKNWLKNTQYSSLPGFAYMEGYPIIQDHFAPYKRSDVVHGKNYPSYDEALNEKDEVSP